MGKIHMQHPFLNNDGLLWESHFNLQFCAAWYQRNGAIIT